jgi:hypothetical protein
MMLSTARAVVEIRHERERRAQRYEMLQRSIVVREGTCQERWGSWGSRERLQDRPKL